MQMQGYALAAVSVPHHNLWRASPAGYIASPNPLVTLPT
jgi:hypothetical protein